MADAWPPAPIHHLDHDALARLQQTNAELRAGLALTRAAIARMRRELGLTDEREWHARVDAWAGRRNEH